MKTIITVLFLLCFSSCGTDKNIEKYVTYFAKIQMAGEISQDAQQKFIDKATDVVIKIKYDNSIIIDTSELHVLLEEAKQASVNRLALLNSFEEVDEEISYRSKVIKYNLKFTEAYQKVFKELINIVSKQTEDRFEKASKLLTPKLLSLKESQLLCETAAAEFKAKYNITTVIEPAD